MSLPSTYTALEALAQNASHEWSPGDWYSAKRVAEVITSPAAADFVAGCVPQTVVAIIEQLRATEGALAEAEIELAELREEVARVEVYEQSLVIPL